MLKEILAFSMLFSINNSPNVIVDKIEGYQSNETIKRIDFDFKGNYSVSSNIEVTIDLYSSEEKYLRRYINDLTFISNKRATTKIDFGIDDDFYVLIDIESENQMLVEDAKINFYKQDDCYININNKQCKRIYKSVYGNGVSRDLYTDFKIKDNVFNKYLKTNKLNLNEISYNSEYSFIEANSYFILKEKVDGYDLVYLDGYLFPLGINYDSYYSFFMLNDYYVDIIDFKYRENSFYNSSKTSSIHFPFNEDYKEYLCNILIDDFIDIYVEFSVCVSDKLLGDCKDSKYCLMRIKYD